MDLDIPIENNEKNYKELIIEDIPEGYIAPDIIKLSYPPTNPNGNIATIQSGISNFPILKIQDMYISDKNPQIQFDIRACDNFLDTRELCLEGKKKIKKNILFKRIFK
jgi:hypothetical protein